jgi:hypothetical protein
VQAKKLMDVGPSFSHVSLHPFNLHFRFIFMPLLCFYVLLSIGVPTWLNDGPDTSLERDEQSKKKLETRPNTTMHASTCHLWQAEAKGPSAALAGRGSVGRH